jgi:ABC-type multidrug transport system fused ATPase/permease subunit
MTLVIWRPRTALAASEQVAAGPVLVMTRTGSRPFIAGRPAWMKIACLEPIGPSPVSRRRCGTSGLALWDLRDCSRVAARPIVGTVASLWRTRVTWMGDDKVVIQAESLSKRYGRVQALDRLSLEVRAGEVLGFLGPNGAGKPDTKL